MNTPAHAILNLLVLGRKERPQLLGPIVAGSLLPDLPMFGFYLYQKLIMTRSEQWIWTEGYSQASWQALFDTFNSLPIIGLGLFIAWRLGSLPLVAFFASMGLHVLGDFALHHDDAHRHFFPLSNWRFSSPISYWDPAHYGGYVASAEVAMVLVGGGYLLVRHSTRWARAGIGLVMSLYVVYLVFAIAMWM